MKWTDPSIKLIAAGSSQFPQRHRLDRLEPHGLEYLKRHDRLSCDPPLCRQPRQRLSRFLCQFDRSERADQDHRRRDQCGDAFGRAAATARFTSPGTNGTSGIARAAAQQRGRRILEERYNLEDALVVATFLNSFVNHRHIVKMANMAQLVNVIAPIFTNESRTVPPDHLLSAAMFANNTKARRSSCSWRARSIRSKRFGDVPYLDTRPRMTTERWSSTSSTATAIRPSRRTFETSGQEFAGPSKSPKSMARISRPRTTSTRSR